MRKMIKRQRRINDITEEQWIEHLTQLYEEAEKEYDRERNNERIQDRVQIAEEGLNIRIKQLKNKKAKDPDGKHNKLIKYGKGTLCIWF